MNLDYITSIYTSYLTVKDSIKVTRRTLKADVPYVYNKTIFEDLKQTEVGDLTGSAKKEIERWSISEIIDLFDFAVDGNLRGKLKQILEYRNWIAHGKNPNALPSIRKTEPKTTYDTILEFIKKIKDYDRIHSK